VLEGKARFHEAELTKLEVHSPPIPASFVVISVHTHGPRPLCIEVRRDVPKALRIIKLIRIYDEKVIRYFMKISNLFE
jgi:hypothetical protein